MDATQKEKIARFLNDRVMSEAVRQVFLEAFMKKRGKWDDTYQQQVVMLAASRIAIDLFEDGWKDLQKYKSSTTEREERPSNIAV